MKKFTCDICKAEVKKEYDLNSLIDKVKKDDLNHACNDCLKEINEVYFRIGKIVNEVKLSWINRFISKFHKKKMETNAKK